MHEIVASFDLDETLVVDRRLERTVAIAALETLAARQGTSYDRDAATLAIDTFFASDRDVDRTIDTFVAWFYERFARAGAPAIAAANGFRSAVLAAAASHVDAITGARETLAELDRLAIPYALLTNGWSPLQEEKARLLGFRGAVFVSERIGARKPAPEAFAVVREHFGVAPECIWHIGDNPVADCAGAKAAGMTAVWFDRRGERYPTGIAAPDFVVRSHAELLALLSGAAVR